MRAPQRAPTIPMPSVLLYIIHDLYKLGVSWRFPDASACFSGQAIKKNQDGSAIF
jgi:hypothetical protein